MNRYRLVKQAKHSISQIDKHYKSLQVLLIQIEKLQKELDIKKKVLWT